MESERGERTSQTVDINTVIVGGGQSGLAMSRCLMEKGVDHIILEKGRLVERWYSQRWDSLRLLTPNWMTRLPGYCYSGDDPDGFMTAQETIKFFQDYAESFQAPVQLETEVSSVQRVDEKHLRVQTNTGQAFLARNVIIATGFCDQPRVPAFATHLSKDICQLAPSDYKRPSQVPEGNVLVVGASATGCQIAQELLDFSQTNGLTRHVTLAVGRHTRLPRRYRGKDILHWLYAIGFFDAPVDPSTERNAPAPQIIGTPDHRDMGLAILQSRGVELVGKAIGLKKGEENGDNQTIEFDKNLQQELQSADSRLAVLLKKIDDYISSQGIDAPAANLLEPVKCPVLPPTEISLKQAGIRTIIWATGYVRSYPWLKDLPSLLDENGDVRQKQGVTLESGVYILGMRFQRTRNSNFIDGVGADAKFVAEELVRRNG